MLEDTFYMPRNDFEQEMKRDKGFPYFRKYRQQLEVDKEKERKLFEKYESKI